MAIQRSDYSDGLPQLQKSSQEQLNKLWFESKHQFNRYILGYLIAAFLFFIDKILNVKPEEY